MPDTYGKEERIEENKNNRAKSCARHNFRKLKSLTKKKWEGTL